MAYFQSKIKPGEDVWFVNCRMIPWPPEPLRMAASQIIRGYLHLEDAIYEHKMAR